MNKIKSINSSVEVFGFKISLDSSNALQLISQFDCVVDCTDNVATRYLLNDACYHSQIPLVSGAALRYLHELVRSCNDWLQMGWTSDNLFPRPRMLSLYSSQPTKPIYSYQLFRRWCYRCSLWCDRFHTSHRDTQNSGEPRTKKLFVERKNDFIRWIERRYENDSTKRKTNRM